jgi:hypothetical protein
VIEGLEVIAGGQGIVSHAGLVLLRRLADRTRLRRACRRRWPRRGRRAYSAGGGLRRNIGQNYSPSIVMIRCSYAQPRIDIRSEDTLSSAEASIYAQGNAA